MSITRLSTPIFFALGLLWTAPAGLGSPPQSSAGPVPTVLITGSNRGIGLEFARQYAEKGWRVLATTRRPDGAQELRQLEAARPNLTIEPLDVTDRDQIRSLAAKYRDQPIDLLINNAGVLGDREKQALDRLDGSTFAQVMAVNVLGALQVSQAFLKQVESSRQKKIVALTSTLGSLTLTRGRGGGLYFYRISKAGVNMAMRTLQAEVGERGITASVISPGAVYTDMLRQVGYRGPAQTPAESVSKMIRVIEELGPETAGAFLNNEGELLPW